MLISTRLTTQGDPLQRSVLLSVQLLLHRTLPCALWPRSVLGLSALSPQLRGYRQALPGFPCSAAWRLSPGGEPGDSHRVGSLDSPGLSSLLTHLLRMVLHHLMSVPWKLLFRSFLSWMLSCFRLWDKSGPCSSTLTRTLIS